MNFSRTLFVFLCLGVTHLMASPPTISHEPAASVAAGQPLKLIARVTSAEPLKAVTLHVSQSGNTAPVDLPMQAAGAGVFYGTIPPRLFAGADSFRYYMDAHTESGEWAETPWVTLRVIGSGLAGSGERESSWKRPAMIVAGGAVALGAGLALSGGGGGGGDSSDDSGTGDVDLADQVIIRTASDSVSSASPILPSVTSLDAADELSGRTIDRVRIRIEFDGVDGAAESFEASYNGSTVLSGTATGARSEQVDVLGTSDTQVLFRVLSSQAGADGISEYSWNATVTFFLTP